MKNPTDQIDYDEKSDRKEVSRSMKKLFNQEVVMLMVLCVVVVAVMFGATVAWFVGQSPATVSNMELTLEDKGDLYVWVKVENPGEDESESGTAEPGEEESTSETETSVENTKKTGYVPLQQVGTKAGTIVHKLDLNIVKLENITENTFAPGAYGKVEFKFLSKTSLTEGYKITIAPSIKVNSNFESKRPEGMTEDSLLDVVKSHIKFYAKNNKGEYTEVILYDDDCAFLYNGMPYSTDNFTFTDDVIEGLKAKKLNTLYPMRLGLQGYLEENVIKDVVLYWYWPYEFKDIPECLEIKNEDSMFYSEFKKYTDFAITGAAAGLTESQIEAEQIEAYDWDDTYIGNYIDELIFHIDVEAVRKSDN